MPADRLRFRHFRPNTVLPACCCTSRLCPHLMVLVILDPAAFSFVDRLHDAGQGIGSRFRSAPLDMATRPINRYRRLLEMHC